MAENGPIVLTVTGMTCDGCVGAVTRALQRQPGVAAVTVHLADGRAVIEGAASRDTLVGALRGAGFDALPG